MEQLDGRTAFITGGASGMGLGMAYAFGRAGMKVMLADLREDRLHEAQAALSAEGIECATLRVDVADRGAMADAAQATLDRFGTVDLVIANAGVGIVGRVRDASYDDWDWSNSVNLGGVVNTIQSFLPILRRQGSGHLVATSSMAGLTHVAHGGVYSVQKAAVMAIMESLSTELVDEGIEVSVICPGMTRTNIGETLKLRPAHFAEHGIEVKVSPLPPATDGAPSAPSPMDAAMDPMELGERVLAGVRAGDLYILTHNEFAEQIAEEFEPILAAMPADRMPPPSPGAPAPKVMFSTYSRILERKRAAAR